MKILFLYTELAGYFLACVEALIRNHDTEVMIFRWPVNPEAPFDFRFPEGVQVRQRAGLSWQEVYAAGSDFEPDLVFMTGWIDKGYMRAARQFRRKGIPVIAGLDNQWTGSIKQRLATWISPLYLHRHIDYLWVAGIRQYEYARRLGFAHDRIRLGYYSADVALFFFEGLKYLEEKSRNYPHNLLYVGRLMEHKGIEELCRAFLETSDSHDWTLTLVGKGEVEAGLLQTGRILVRAFVQPEKLPELAATAGAFVLPSRHEPWGVVLHEFAAAGLPLIASDACGAGDAFLRDGYNGFRHRAADPESLRTAILRITRCPDAALHQMGIRSAELAKQITPQSWAATLVGVGRGKTGDGRRKTASLTEERWKSGNKN